MSYAETDIIYELGPFFVLSENDRFLVMENGATHATVRATIDYPGQKGIDRAIEEVNKRTDSGASA